MPRTAYAGPLLRPWRAAGGGMVALLVVLCLSPLKHLPLDEITWIDKVYHLVAFAELMWWFAVVRPTDAWWRLAAWLAGLGAGIELAQVLVPYRSGSFGDLAADLLGVALGAGLALLTPAGFPPVRPAECGQIPPVVARPEGAPDTTVRDDTRRRP